MKFTIITRYYHPTPDGIGHHSGYLNQYLLAAGHSVQVIYDDGIISLSPHEINLLINKINRQNQIGSSFNTMATAITDLELLIG